MALAYSRAPLATQQLKLHVKRLSYEKLCDVFRPRKSVSASQTCRAMCYHIKPQIR